MRRVNSILGLFLMATLVMVSCKKDTEVLNEENDITQLQQEILNEKPHLHDDRSCGMKAHMNQLMQDANYKKAHNQKLELMKAAAASSSSRAVCSDPVVLPVAVHFQGVPSPDAVCLRQLAQSQIQVLNDDYQGSNSDITNWTNTASSQFPGISNAETCLEFCIATKNHPSGYNLSNGDLAVTINQTAGDNNNDWSGYLNIFVQFNTGVLGYSPLGGSGNGDGVVIDANAFGSGSGCGQISPNAPYNLGRTLTHELGHYLLLDHIWGGGCGSDDDVADTPDSQSPHYGCPNLGVSTCSSTDMHMNYMDYTNDACMYMFSAGQATRMENYVNGNLQNLVNNAANVCGTSGGGGTTPTCNDGIQNGDETGVDCGGSCEPCTVAATCDDGIQNGDETGVDCGGSCEPCTVVATCDDGIQNGDETGIDCGGSCNACPTGDGTADAGVLSILAPKGLTCSDALSPVVRIKNYGSERITSVIIEYGLDGNFTETYSWTGTLKTNKSRRIILPELATPPGPHTLSVRTSNPNNNSDINPSNDLKTRNFRASGNDGQQVIIEVKPDDYGSEITWEVMDNNNNVVASGGPYTDGNTKLRRKYLCLPDGCYTFRIEDAYGDGICCDYGTGWYKVRDELGLIVVSSTGEYGTFEEQQFCVGDQIARIGTTKNDAKKVGLKPKAGARASLK